MKCELFKISSYAMSEVSIELLKDPFNITKWNHLFRSPELRVNKTSSIEKLQSVMSIYSNFLKIYPLLENYWIRYIDIEFDLSNFDQCNQIYDEAFKYLSYSVNLWVKYLNFKLATEPVTIDNCIDYLHLFETARSFIGLSYHSSDFYKLYLEFLKTYSNVNPELNFQKKYEFLLRYILEIPLYNFGYFFKLFQEHETKFKYSNISKKNLVELYIVTQSKSFKLYEYEKNLLNFYHIKYITINELKCWSKYLQFIELHYSHEHVIQAYERAIIRTSNYDDIYLQYCNYLINLKKFDTSILLLKRAIGLRNYNKSKLINKLIDLQTFKSNYLLAKSLSLNTSLSKIVSLEWLFGNEKILESLFKVKQCWELLLYYNIDDSVKLKMFKLEDIEKNDEYYNALNLWLKFNPKFRAEFEPNHDDFDDELNKFL